jgi:adenylosuccinate lyase
MTREDAYKIVQTHAHAAWNNKTGSFRDNLLNDPAVVAKLGKDNIIACFDPNYHLKNVGYIYKKLGI